MSLVSLLNESVDVYRLQATSGSKKQRTKVSTQKVMIAPMSATAASVANMAIGRAYTGYAMPSSGILTGDYLQDVDGVKYDVQGTRNYTMGIQPFVEMTLQRQAQQGQV